MELPPLREKTDIKNLTNYFVGTISTEINIPIKETFSRSHWGVGKLLGGQECETAEKYL